jgi:hypothetical protein
MKQTQHLVLNWRERTREIGTLTTKSCPAVKHLEGEKRLGKLICGT